MPDPTDVAPPELFGPEIRTADLPARTLAGVNFAVPIPKVTWEPPPLEELATKFPGYRLTGFLGRGGMGAVYEGIQTELHRRVAIKILPQEVCDDKSYQIRFAKEAQALAHLSDPRIIGIHDFGAASGYSYIVMEFVEGRTLAELIDDASATMEAIVSAITDVCEGLIHAHEKGIVHRDLKPSNILLDASGRAKIADFGIATLPASQVPVHGMTTGAVFGTPEFMSPEQLRRDQVDQRTDIYAVGAILQHVLRKRRSDTSRTERALTSRIRKIATKAISSDPSHRQGSASSMLSSLRLAKFLSRFGLSSGGQSVAVAIVVLACVVVAFRISTTSVKSSDNHAAIRQKAHVATSQTKAAQPVRTTQIGDLSPKYINWLEEAGRSGATPVGLERVSNGYKAAQVLRFVCGPDLRDQALRVSFVAPSRVVRTGASRSALQLFVRSTADGKNGYSANAFLKEWHLVRRTGEEAFETLIQVPKSAAAGEQGTSIAEIRAIGDELSLYFDGVLATTIRDKQYTHGFPRLCCGEGVLITNIEWADLSAP